MSSVVEERVLYDLTKKEKVIYLAQKDPFLKVERISQLAETTPHYVRTVLSEANLSLTKLRKQYAQKLKDKRRANKFLLDILSTDKFDKLDLTKKEGVVLNKAEYYSDLIKEGNNFLERTVLFKEGGFPIMVNTTFISDGLQKFDELNDRKDLFISENKVRVEMSNDIVARLLEINTGVPVLILEKEIYISQKLKGVDLLYLIPERVELLLKENNHQISVVKCNKH
ncbi:hypothetical protein U472_03080 [Orenia metallireducens]|jgi:DNA-binding GntR family transcriptional regulator|uniref:Uncharacterized protein n=1 Tax=Orenia metallireducens TaxID=1413210 RepID=A0A1C0AB23_9FIRM|nr:hypothetical protein [Orenia metallireducens]OCL27556.1 hypothetical protein U472_03080 [Orenia metallireducens]